MAGLRVKSLGWDVWAMWEKCIACCLKEVLNGFFFSKVEVLHDEAKCRVYTHKRRVREREKLYHTIFHSPTVIVVLLHERWIECAACKRVWNFPTLSAMFTNFPLRDGWWRRRRALFMFNSVFPFEWMNLSRFVVGFMTNRMDCISRNSCNWALIFGTEEREREARKRWIFVWWNCPKHTVWLDRKSTESQEIQKIEIYTQINSSRVR